ncbi:MAG: RNA polymerase sigma factor [Actinomycetota bacterium]
MEGRPLEDRELVDRAGGGDKGAYEQLVRRHQDIAFRTAYAIAGGTAEAEDAAQEGFVKAYLALDRFKAGSDFRPWLLAIVANEARNRVRSAVRRSSLALRAERDRPSGGAAPSPEEAVVAREDQEILLRGLARLAEADRLVLTYRYLLDLNEAEAAAALGCPRGTVKSRLSRALQRLRRQLEREMGAGDD